MKRLNYSYVAAVAFAALLSSSLVSCVNEEYDVNDLNPEVTLMEEGLTLPLGSTKQLALKDLLSGLDEDMLQVLEGGAYAFRITDSLSLGDQLPDLEDIIEIPDVTFSNKSSFNLSGLDMESLSIEGQTFDYKFGLADEGMMPDIEVPAIGEKHENKTKVWEYGKAAREMEIDLGEDKTLTTKPLFALPEMNVTEKVEVNGLPEADVAAEELKVIIKAESPEGISEISDVMMSKGSSISVKLSVVNSFLAEGVVVPAMELDLAGLMTLDGDKEKIVLGDDFKLDKTNGWTASKDFAVKKINIDADDWDEEGLLELAKTFVVSGKAAVEKAAVDPQSLASYDKTKGMSLRVDIGFKDMTIESMMMTLDGIEPVKEKMEIPMNMADLVLPDGVKSIDKVEFTDASVIEMMVKLNNLDIKGLKTELKSMTMSFPEGFKVREAVDGKVEFSGDLSEGLDKKLHVEQIEFPAPVDGKIAFGGNVTVEAEVTIGGRINSADVPYTEDKDGSFGFEVVSDLEIEEYYAQIEGMEHNLDMEPEEFIYDLPAGVSDIGTFVVIPEGNPVMEIDLDLPETSLKIQAAEGGLNISFPEFIRFKNVDSSYGFDAKTNSVTLKGDLPEKIQLPVEKIVVAPKYDAAKDAYYAGGQIAVSGAVALPAGTVTGSDVDEIVSSEASVVAMIPDLKAAEVAFEHFAVNVEESFDFDIFKARDLPEEVKSVSRIDLADVKVVFDVAVRNMPDLGADPSVDLMITMPDVIVLDETDKRVDGNVVAVSGKIKDGKIAIDPICVKAIDLSDFDFSAGKDLKGNIAISGSIELENPEIDLASLDGDIIIDLKAGIEDIVIEKIQANVDYRIDGINEKVELTGLPDFVKGEDFVLDLANPHLILKVNTNMGIPVSGELKIIPSFGGVIDTDAAIIAQIELPHADTADQMEEVVFWFGGDKSKCPADYTFVEADINKLIRRIPDELELSLVAGTDADKDCVVEPSADYVLDVEYDFVIPLEFGEDLHIEISDTISGLPPIMGQLLEKNSVQLAGSITSSLPLSLELNIDMLDDDDKVVPVDKPAKLAIAPCASDGSAATSPLDLTLDVKDGVSVKGLSSLKLTFKVTAPNFTGVPIDEADFVQAELKLAVPDGITLDIADLNE